MREPTQARIFRNIGTMSFDLVLVRRTETGREIARTKFTPMEPNVSQPPTAHLSDDECQQLIDDLFAAGFRPTEGRDTAGALAAMRAHLADMRQIAFSKLEVSKPEDKTT